MSKAGRYINDLFLNGMDMNIIYSVFFIGLSLLLTKLYCVRAQGTRLMDKPNERSLHVIPTVRGGGLVFVGLFLSSIPLVGYYLHVSLSEQLLLFMSVLLVAGVSFCDDLYQLSAKKRFAIQAIASGLAVGFLYPQMLDLLLFSLTNSYVVIGLLFFTMLWAINHFNFMDGLDGFCGSQALFLFIAYGLLFHIHGALFYQSLCFILSFALIGFLAFNFPPAKLFMGDVGSATLGFITFYMALVGQQQYQIPMGYWCILNSLFLFDATITLLRRIHNKEQWFAPHKKHAYQRLKQYGLNTRVILLGQLLINLSLLVGVFLIQFQGVSVFLFFIMMLLVLGIAYYLVEKRYPMFS